MCFLSSIEMVGVTLSYPVVMGIEMTLGTFLLYLLDRDALNVGPLRGAAVRARSRGPRRPGAAPARGQRAPGRAAGGGRPARAPALKRPVAGQGRVPPEGDDDELDYVFDSDHSDDACVPIERLVDALADEDQNSPDDKPQGVRRGSAALSPPACCCLPAGEALSGRGRYCASAFMVVLGLSHLLFCLILLPVRAAYLRRSGSKQPPSVGICSAAWGYGSALRARPVLRPCWCSSAGETSRPPLQRPWRDVRRPSRHYGAYSTGARPSHASPRPAHGATSCCVVRARRSCSSRGRLRKIRNTCAWGFSGSGAGCYVAGPPRPLRSPRFSA